MFDDMKKILGILSFGMLPSSFGNGSGKIAIEPSDMRQKFKIEQVAWPEVKETIRYVEFKTDTLDTPSRTVMYYLNRQIVRNYVENNNSYRLQLPVLAHEDWHAHNNDLGYRYKYFASPEEYFKLCMHDEITANIVAVLTARYEYLASENKDQVIKKYERGYAGFYFNAVKNKQIHPESTDPQDIVNERKFIANGMRKIWMKCYAPVYKDTHYNMLKRYMERKGMSAETKETYLELRRKMYTIGGVDFWSYMDEDIAPKKDMVSLFEGMGKVESLKKHNKAIFKDVEKQCELLERVDCEYQREAFQHIFIAARVKQILKGVNAEGLKKHPYIITLCYQKVFSQLKTDETFKNFIDNSCLYRISGLKNKSYDDYRAVLSDMYTMEGVDLSKQIQGFSALSVPVKDGKIGNFSFDDPSLGALVNDNFENTMVASLLSEEHITENTAGTTISSPKKESRRSTGETLCIPNFREPILVANTPQQDEEIYVAMRQFDAIPQVFKECNTKAQKAYLLKNPQEKYACLLKNQRERD